MLALKHTKGFSLIELMIVLAIVAILTTIAVPTYQQYLKRARYSEIITSILPYKLGVSLCYQSQGKLSGCNNNVEGIPNSVTSANNQNLTLINTLIVKNGIITATPKSVFGFKTTDNYILKPIIATNQLQWKASGKAVELGYAK